MLAERLEHGRPLTADYLEAARELLPHVGAVDRASFCLVEWAWRRQSRPAHYARIWFLHGLEPAQPYASRLELPEEVAPR